MACNCETQNEINKLYKAYSAKSQLPEEPKLIDYITHYGGNILAYSLMLICFPLLILYVLALAFWREDERIHITDIDLIKIFKVSKN